MPRLPPGMLGRRGREPDHATSGGIAPALARRSLSVFAWLRCWRRGIERAAMDIDTDKIDDVVLALLYLTLHDEFRAWKGHGWGALDRIHEKGVISNTASKAKSVVRKEEG